MIHSGHHGAPPRAALEKQMAQMRSEAGRVCADDLVWGVRWLFSQTELRPPRIPRVALELHDLSRRAGARASDAIRLLELDPWLAGGVCAVAGSIPASPDAPGSLREVVARMGVRGLANLALEVGTAPLFSGIAAYEAELRAHLEHALEVAHAANIVAAKALPDDEPAFMAGLLHDVGSAIGLIALASGRLSPAPLPYREALPVLLEAHEELGVIAADAWHLPLEVREVIADHHGAPRSALTELVRVVDRPCRERSAP
jgi:putative nucleotidyltransferase with HDIG domain